MFNSAGNIGQQIAILGPPEGQGNLGREGRRGGQNFGGDSEEGGGGQSWNKGRSGLNICFIASRSGSALQQ